MGDMIRYEWKCKLCNVHESVDVHLNNRYCYRCSSWMVRVYGFSYHKPMQPHFNPSVGKYVSNTTQFADELKKQDEVNWKERGIESRLVPIDPRDTTRTGATEEGMENTYRQQRQGQEAKKLIL